MKKMKLGIFALMLCIILPKNVFAIDNNSCIIYEKGNKIIDVTNNTDLINDFENDLKQRVFDLNENNGKGVLVNYMYNYKMNVERKTSEEKTEVKTILVDNKFISKEDAKNYFDSIVSVLPYVKGSYTISPLDVSRIENVKGEDIVCKSVDCHDEINKLKEALKDNQKLHYNIVVSENAGSKKLQVDYKENNEIKYFDTKESAESFANSYIPVKEGFKFVNNEYVEVPFKIEVMKTYAQLKGNDVFDTKEEALEKLEEFQDEYNTTNGKVDPIRVSSKDKIETGSISFDTQEEVDKWIFNNKIDSTLGKLVTNVTSTKEKYDESDIYFEFDSLEEAEAKIIELKNNGYNLNSNITNISGGMTGEVLTGEKYDSNNRYEFANTNFVLIKQGSGHYAVWTKEQLTEEEKDLFVSSYNKVNSGDSKFDGSTTNISKSDISWIYGYGSFDLSYIANNWGTYIFEKNGNNIVLTCDKKKVSHVIKGYAKEESSKYVLSGTKYKEKDVYKLDYSKILYGFSYKINASALVEEITTKYKVVSNFIELKKTALLEYSIDTTIIDKMYELSYEEYIPKVIDNAYINWKITRCTYPQDSNVQEVAVDYPNPPQTGVDYKLPIVINVFALGVLLISRKIYKVLKNN